MPGRRGEGWLEGISVHWPDVDEDIGIGRRLEVEILDVKRTRELRSDAINEPRRQVLVEQEAPSHPGAVAILRSRSAA